MALNNIIENDLEQNSEEILKLFNILENAKNEKERKNLIKLKKALYLIKISRSKEGNSKLLQEIISQKSIWGNIALELSNNKLNFFYLLIDNHEKIFNSYNIFITLFF